MLPAASPVEGIVWAQVCALWASIEQEVEEDIGKEGIVGELVQVMRHQFVVDEVENIIDQALEASQPGSTEVLRPGAVSSSGLASNTHERASHTRFLPLACAKPL